MKKRKNTRYTRRSYKRKLIVFGVSIFMSLALSATGFAAWVISRDAEEKAEGAVEIGAVTESSVEITNIEFIADDGKVSTDARHKSFIFEPQAGDTTGRVRYDGSSEPENLDIEFTWTVKNFQIVGDLYVDFKIPADVYKAISDPDHPERNWIALPEKFVILDGFEENPINGKENAPKGDYKIARYVIQDIDQETPKKIDPNGTGDNYIDDILKYKVTKTDEGIITDVTFTMKIAFKWGSSFDSLNPGIYYDTEYKDSETKGSKTELDEVKDTLTEFKATLHGITYDDTFKAKTDKDKADEYEANPIDSFYIVINAKVA